MKSGLSFLFIFCLTACSTFDIERAPASSQAQSCVEMINEFEQDLIRIDDHLLIHTKMENFKGLYIEGNHFSASLYGVYKNEESMEYLGKFSVQPELLANGSIDEEAIHISYIELKEDARGLGLQNIFYMNLLEHMPKLKQISSNLEETNLEVFEQELIELLKDKRVYRSRSSLAQSLNSLKPATREELLEQAIKETPAYKSRKHIGFDLCPDNTSIKIYSFDPLDIELTSCKKP